MKSVILEGSIDRCLVADDFVTTHCEKQVLRVFLGVRLVDEHLIGGVTN